MEWYEKAEEEIMNDFNDGEITREEYKRQLRQLREEVRESKECHCDHE
jgi:uncharacterized membrane protein